MPQGTIVTLHNPYLNTFGMYRNYRISGFAVLADSISKFVSYKTAKLGITNNNNFMPYENRGIITHGTDPNKLDKNGNAAFYMGVRLQDFYNEYGRFTPEVGDRYIFVESKLYGDADSSYYYNTTLRWFYDVGGWGINPITGEENTVTAQSPVSYTHLTLPTIYSV